jgi:hypothetical protein
MAQGFKAKVGPGKQRSTASVNKQAGKMKKGGGQTDTTDDSIYLMLMGHVLQLAFSRQRRRSS